MDTILDFFVDPLVKPVYFYFFSYALVWMLAFGLSRLIASSGKPGCFDQGADKGWKFAFIAHFVAGLLMIVWVTKAAFARQIGWLWLSVYLSPYLFFVIFDFFFFFDMGQGKSTKKIRLRGKARRPKP